jgi:CheY-like chemotaxis protein
MTILYVEDDPEDQQIFKEAMSIVSPHSTVHFAMDGIKATELLYSLVAAPDYIFLDLNMPRMDGLQFLYTVKKSEFKEIPVVVFTTSLNELDKKDSQKLGAVRFVSKPNTFTEVCTALKEFV